MMRSGLGTLALALVLFGTALATPVEAQTDRPQITQLEIVGNQTFSDDSLRAAIVNRQTECRLPRLFCMVGIDLKRPNYLLPRELPLDQLRLQYYYRQRGYREAQVDTTVRRLDGEVQLTFEITEGRPVRVDSIDVMIWDDVADSAFARALPIATGDALSDLQLDAARDSIEVRLKNQGYVNAEVLVSNFVPSGSYEARVTFDVYPGRPAHFGAVRVVGNEQLDSLSILRMLPFRRGDLYRLNQIAEGQRNLYGLELIQSARIVQQVEPDDTIVPLEVRVAEGQLHRVRAGFGWTTVDCLNTEALWSSRNFAGGARRLSVRGRVSNILAGPLNATACSQAGSGRFADLNGQLAVELFQPWFLSPRNSLSVSAFFERQSVPNVFIRRALGLNLAASRNVGARATLALGYQPTLTQLDAAEVFLCASFLACLPSDLRIFREANWLSPISLRLTQDFRNSLLDPSSGYYWFADFEHARRWTGSDFSFDRAVVEASGYLQTGSAVLATRIRAGAVGRGRFLADGNEDFALVHPQKRFFSGGANSVRGFAENELGPRVLTVPVERVLSVPAGGEVAPCQPEQLAFGGPCDPSPLADDAFTFRAVGGTWVVEANAEVRFPLFTPALQGVAFFDVGQVWVARADVSWSDLAMSPGIGVRYRSPIGPVRVDLGYGNRGAESLPVAVSRVRPFDAQIDDPDRRLVVRRADGANETIDWVSRDDLDFLFPTRTFGGSSSFLSRLQLHISLGQAF